MKAKMATCNKCGARVLTTRLADHWIIAGHHSKAGATRVSFPLDRAGVMREHHTRGNA